MNGTPAEVREVQAVQLATGREPVANPADGHGAVVYALLGIGVLMLIAGVVTWAGRANVLRGLGIGRVVGLGGGGGPRDRALSLMSARLLLTAREREQIGTLGRMVEVEPAALLLSEHALERASTARGTGVSPVVIASVRRKMQGQG